MSCSPRCQFLLTTQRPLGGTAGPATLLEKEGTLNPVLRRQIAFLGGQIAGGAEDRTVVTENISDFQAFADMEGGIQVENWFSE